MEDDTFGLHESFNVWYYNNEWELDPLYLDYHDGVVSINIDSLGVDGTFYVYCHGQKYRHEVKYDYDEEGDWWAGHDWVLNSFDIDAPGYYDVVVKYGDDEATSEVIDKFTLNVTEFNYDAFRTIHFYLIYVATQY